MDVLLLICTSKSLNCRQSFNGVCSLDASDRRKMSNNFYLLLKFNMEKRALKEEDSLSSREIELLIDRILYSRISNATERKDVKQDVYLKVLAASKKYVDQGKLLSWISVIARND